MNSAGFLTAYGKFDSHAVKLKTGKLNPNPRAGLPYDSISWHHIVELTRCPAAVEKAAAQFVVPSTYIACDGRTAEAQLKHGQFGMLAVDIDHGNSTLPAVLEALDIVLGRVASLIYSSSSARADHRKWRVLIPLSEPIPGADYPGTQDALFALLTGQGIVCDGALARAGQPIFLPNVPMTNRGADGLPLFYQYRHTPGEGLTLADSHPIFVQRKAAQAATERNRREAAQRSSDYRSARVGQTASTREDFDPIPHFNAHHSISDMLVRYGFEQDQRGKGWKSPLSESGSFSTRDEGSHWVTVSAWAGNYGVGRESRNGNRYGDAFDLYAHFEHGGDTGAAVRAYAQAVRPRDLPRLMGSAGPELRPRYILPAGDLATARATVDKAFDDWIAAAVAWSEIDPSSSDSSLAVPLAVAVRVTTGVGKSTSALRAIQRLSELLPATGASGPIVLAVPRHDLADHFQAELEAAGLQVEVYKGRDQQDSLSPRHLMCRRHIEAREVERSGCSVAETLCTQRGIHCPFKDVCGTQRQARTRSPIWIVPHAVLWRKPPACIGAPAALIVDEDPSQGVFAGFESTPYQVSLDELTYPMRGLSDYQNADILAATNAIAKAARMTRDDAGRVMTADIALSAEDITAARKIAFDGLLKPDCGPLTPAGQLATELERVAATNTQVLRIARLLDIVRAAMEAGSRIVPGLQVAAVRTSDGLSVTAIQMRWKNKLADGWRVPTICSSATMRPELLHTVWPEMERIAEAQAVMPFTTIRQVTDLAFGQSSLVGDDVYKSNLRRRVRHYIECRAEQAGGLVLVVAQKGVIGALGALPAGVETLHFNALSGIDRYKDARLIIVIGRTQPAPGDVEARAELIMNNEITRLQSWYDKVPAALTMADGSAGPHVVTRRGKGQQVLNGADQHPHAMAEAIRWMICEAELIQTVGRGRGVNRTADTPLQIDILTSVPLPLPVDEAGAFSEFEPTPADLLQARGVEMTDTSAKGAWHVVSAMLSDVFPTAEAARKAWKRAAEATTCSRGQILIGGIIRICPRERLIEAKAKANGSRYAVGVRVRAKDWADAESLLSGYGIEAECLAPQAAVDASPTQQDDIEITHQCTNRANNVTNSQKLMEIDVQTSASLPPADAINTKLRSPRQEPHLIAS